jgi:hypothetical protein
MLGDTRQALSMSPDAAAMNAMGATLTPGLAEAPAIFRETLLFPYIDGWVFALSVAQAEQALKLFDRIPAELDRTKM